MLGLTHYCPVCGMDVEKETGVTRFGKYFCSEEHALQYAEHRMNKQGNSSRYDGYGFGGGGGCCC